MKIWLDDIREAPEGWVWCKCAESAIQALKHEKVTEISLDHDLSFDHYRGIISYGEKTGYDVICFMEENNVWPEKVYCHSLNPVGREKIEKVIIEKYGKLFNY